MILKTTPVPAAEGLTAEIYYDETASLGYVPTHTQAMAINPEAYLAVEAMLQVITASLDLRRYELVTLAAA